MLEEIIKIVSKSGSNSLQGISKKLNISKELLLQMIKDLERGGYLKLLEVKCSTECEKCPYMGSCAITSFSKIWTLTKKGFKLAEKS